MHSLLRKASFLPLQHQDSINSSDVPLFLPAYHVMLIVPLVLGNGERKGKWLGFLGFLVLMYLIVH